MTRREFVAATAVSALALGQQRTARSQAEYYFERIRDIDPKLRSVIEINPDALRIASQLDTEPSRGPLHGLAVLIKDNINTADRMKTTAGSLALDDAPAPRRDSYVAERLRKSGAVILGKTNLSEWANFRSTHSISGWSGRGGQTRNPYALDRNPSGSSSGSGAAVAAELCWAAVGTETDGSIVSPASVCGIVGIKPTVGLIGGSGIVPISHTQDTAGPMARTVRDAALLLSALNTKGEDYTNALDERGLKGARLGVARKFFGKNAHIDKLIEGCIAEMKRLGADIVDPADMPKQGELGDAEFDVLLYDFKTDLNAYLESRNGPIKSIAQLIDFDEKHRREEMPFFEQEILIMAEKKGPLTENAYIEAAARCRRLTREEGIDAVLQKHKLDAIVAPTNGPACLIDTVNGDYDTGSCSSPAAIAGYPHITVPAGFVHGLPVGISFFGTAWTESKLIRIAYAFEQATKARRPPTLPATIERGA